MTESVHLCLDFRAPYILPDYQPLCIPGRCGGPEVGRRSNDVNRDDRQSVFFADCKKRRYSVTLSLPFILDKNREYIDAIQERRDRIANAGNRIRPNKANLINLRIWRCQSTGATGNPTNFHGNPRNLSYLWLRFKQPKNPGFFWGGYIPLPRLIVLKRVQNPMIGLQIFLALIFLAWQRRKQRCVSICHGLAPLVPNSSRSPLYGVPA